MTDREHRSPHGSADDEAGDDLEYDLAHEAIGGGGAAPTDHEERPVTVTTGTPDYDGDYSYDLAHDIPRS